MPNVGSVTSVACPHCRSEDVTVALAAGGVTFYRCLSCQRGWSDTDRRTAPPEGRTPERRKTR
jgi:transposase-like protein